MRTNRLFLSLAFPFRLLIAPAFPHPPFFRSFECALTSRVRHKLLAVLRSFFLNNFSFLQLSIRPLFAYSRFLSALVKRVIGSRNWNNLEFRLEIGAATSNCGCSCTSAYIARSTMSSSGMDEAVRVRN